MSRKNKVAELDKSVFAFVDHDLSNISEAADAKIMTAAERTKLAGIEDSAKDDQNASEVPFTPAGGLAATDVQAALEELDTEKARLDGATFTGTVLLNGTQTASNAASTVAYVDNKVAALEQGIDPKEDVVAGTTDVLPACTYDNGTAGVGATLTANANGAFPTLDGVTVTQDQRVLVKNQASGFENGIYTLTQVGDGSNPWILTRATDANNADKVTTGMRTFISGGTENSGFSYVITTVGAITIGSTNINFGRYGKDPLATASNAGLMSASDYTKLGNIEENADVTDATNVDAAGAVMESDYDANTVLAADSDNTPAPVTMAEQTVLGRLTGGNIAALTRSQFINEFLLGRRSEMVIVNSTHVTQGYIELAQEPLAATGVKAKVPEGANQFNKANLGSTGETGDFEMDGTNKKRVYIRNADGHTGLSESIIAGDLLEFTYQSTLA
jgi:hypothetical protein